MRNSRRLLFLALTPLIMMAVLAAVLLIVAHHVQQETKRHPLNAYVSRKACIENCKIGISPGVSHVVVISANTESSMPVYDDLQWQTVISSSSLKRIGLARSDADWTRLDPETMDEIIRISAPIPYNDLKSVFGLPVEVFYHPVRQELVTVFSDRVYSSTRMTRACEVEPHILYDAPTTVYYVSNHYLLERLRQSPRAVSLNTDGYVRWVGELNIRIFCTLS